MRSHYRRKRNAYGGSRLPAIVALLLVVGGCVLAYRHFFQRAGEAAANLIPADALLIVTLDLKPSPQQAPTFQRIHDAMQRESIDGQFDQFITSMLSNSPVGKDLRPYVTTSMAYATLKPAVGKMGATVGLFAVSDAGRVRDILNRDAQKTTQDRLDYYQVKGGDNSCMGVVGDYLVVADTPATLMQIVRVHRGETPAVASLLAFQHARGALPADANLMIFIASDSVQQAAAKVAGGRTNRAVANVPWIAIGMAARANGIDTFVQAPVSTPAISDLSQVTPLDLQLLKRLPGGAYGLLALSQPGKYWNQLKTTGADVSPAFGGDRREISHTLDAGLTRFERETGMSVPRDVLPGLYGHALFALYPDGAADGVDGLILLDDANGANPAALADRVRAYAEQQSGAHEQTPLRFTSTVRDGATVWTLDTDSQDQLRHNLNAVAARTQQQLSLSGAPAPPVPPSGAPALVSATPPENGSSGNTTGRVSGTWKGKVETTTMETTTATNLIDGTSVTTTENADGTTKVITRTAGSPTQSVVTLQPQGNTQVVMGSRVEANGGPLDRAIKDKELVYAQVGHAVLIASSRRMMDRALIAYNQGGSVLADEPAYAQMSRLAPAGAQSLVLLDLPGIMEAFRPLLTKSMRGSNVGITPDDIIRMFGQKTGIVGAQQYDGKVIKGYFFLPLDYTRVIHLMGAGKRSVYGGGFGIAVPTPAAPTTPAAPSASNPPNP